jgi:hypothetical protein
MFFSESHPHLFRPLIGKYREQVVECLHLLYNQLYSAMADYRRTLNREQVIELFQEAITRSPVLDEDDEGASVSIVKSERERANWILNQLLEYGWLERLVDEAALQSSYAFTRIGRLFTQPMVELSGGRFRTRHRNTRNTRNALQSFLQQGEVYDLLDAFEYSERIVSDFSDVIAELDERRRQLVQEVEAQQIVQRASDEFFDFMEKRFMPDLAIRLSADSVEKYRDEIQGLISSARRKRNEFKADAERELRKAAPELWQGEGHSIYMMILDGIEGRMHSAAEVMLPALRHALNSFTRRADIIIRQLSYTGAGHQNRLLEICKGMGELSEQEQAEKLETAGDTLAVLNLGLVDPANLRLQMGRTKRVVNTQVESQVEMDGEARKRLFVEQAVEQAFSFNNRAMHDYVVEALSKGHQIRSSQLPIRNARELLMSAHAIDLGSAAHNSEYRFRVSYQGRQVAGEYFDASDEFMIELVERVTDAE